jgi:hypothetical protein
MQTQKSKPIAKWGRKVMGLISDCQTAEGFIALAVFLFNCQSQSEEVSCIEIDHN